jgi:hypothetical protein
MNQSMTYELAEQLRDTGFPQPKDAVLSSYYSKDGRSAMYKYGDIDIYFPTLSELIEACPDHCGLQREDFGWVMYIKGFIREETISDTPEEAVAKLYLNLKGNL